MSFVKVLRNGIAGALMVATPVTGAVAAVRPGAAVPAAGSAAVTAQGGQSGYGSVGWIAAGVIGFTLFLAIMIAVNDDEDGSGELSRG